MTPSPETSKIKSPTSSTPNGSSFRPKFLLSVNGSTNISEPSSPLGTRFDYIVSDASLSSQNCCFSPMIFDIIHIISDPLKSPQCSSLSVSDGDSYECFGENDHMSSVLEPQCQGANVPKEGVDLDLVPHFQKYASATVSRQHRINFFILDSDAEKNSISRHTWSRTSLRGLRGR